MKKKIVSLLLVSAMAATMLAGCGDDAGDDTASSNTEKSDDAEDTDSSDAAKTESTGEYDGVELSYWSMWNNTEPQGKVVEQAAKEFEEKTGAKINIEWKGRDVKDLLATALQAEENIDIFEDANDRISKNLGEFCYDLTEMAETAGYADQSFACFNDRVKEWAGFLCCITEQPQIGGIWYNRDIFEDCGITEVPTTWAEFLEACQTMVDKGYQPLALDATYADFNVGSHLERHLGQDEVKKLSLNGGWSSSEGAKKAADELIEFVNKGYLADGAPDEYPASQNKIGLTGKVAMVVLAQYVCAEVDKATEYETNWGYMNYPSVEGGVTTTDAYAGANSLAISKYSKNPQAAFDFIMYLTSGETDQKMADEAVQIPADPSNTAPKSLDGTVETLMNTTNPLDWSCGINENGDLKASIKEVCVKLFEGGYATGEDFTKALDALY